MSIEASKWAWEQKGLTAAEKLVLLCLADHADDQGENCWPSQERISKKTGVGRESVNRAIKRFRELAAQDEDGKPAVGIIAVVKIAVPNMGSLAYNKYKLLLSHVTKSHPGTTKSHSEKVTKNHSHVTTDHAPCDNLSDFPCDLKSHNPSEENHQKIKPSGREEAPAQEPADFSETEKPDDLGLGDKHPGNIVGWELWNKFAATMAEAGKQPKLYNLELIGVELRRWEDGGSDPRLVVEKALRNSWVTLHDLDPDEKKPPGDDDDGGVLARIEARANGG